MDGRRFERLKASVAGSHRAGVGGMSNCCRILSIAFGWGWSIFPSLLSASELDNPGFGKCAPDMKHAVVPAIKSLTYDNARKKILAAGWKPRITMAETLEYHGNGQANLFWQRGYKEIASCSEGRSHCAFFFEDEFGNRLEAYTVDEEHPELSAHATAYATTLYCPLK